MRRGGEVFVDLMIAVLSVNQYKLEHTWAIRDDLRRAGLFDPERLAQLRAEDIVKLLRSAGCDRGVFMTQLFAERLHSVGQYVTGQGTARVAHVLEAGNAEEIRRLLLPAKGVGPRVVWNFLLLRKGTSEAGS
jgi:hypothetical protein